MSTATPSRSQSRFPSRRLVRWVLAVLGVVVVVGGAVVFARVRTEASRPHDYDPGDLDALADLVNDNFGYDNDARRCEDKPLVAEVDRDLNRVVITRPNDWGLKGHLDDIMRGDYRRFVVGREDWEAKAAGHHFEPGMIVFDKPIHTTVPAGEEVRCPKPK